jgi:hypothetical protein
MNGDKKNLRLIFEEMAVTAFIAVITKSDRTK